MTGGNLLPMALLRRKAVVYVRQSTTQQVNVNLESQRRQYELSRQAVHVGLTELVRLEKRLLAWLIGLNAASRNRLSELLHREREYSGPECPRSRCSLGISP